MFTLLFVISLTGTFRDFRLGSRTATFKAFEHLSLDSAFGLCFKVFRSCDVLYLQLPKKLHGVSMVFLQGLRWMQGVLVGGSEHRTKEAVSGGPSSVQTASQCWDSELHCEALVGYFHMR